MSKRRDYDYLQDIVEAFNPIDIYVSDLSYEEFWRDTKTQDAVIRNIEVIGEAVKNLSNRLKDVYSELPWRDMAGARDKLIHHYFGINYEIVWTIATEELRALKPKIAAILVDIRQET